MSSDEIRQLAVRCTDTIGGPITALRAIQAHRGFIDNDAAQAVAEVFNLSRAEVRGIVSFYSDFRTTPPARNTVRICQAEACQAVGSRALTQTVADHLGIGLGEATSDARVALEAVYCLGLCARGPAMMVNDELVVHSNERALDILKGLE